MKIYKEQQSKLEDTEIYIKYAKMTQQIHQIENVLQSMNHMIEAKCNGVTMKLSPADIFYIESIDKRTYIYGENEVYDCTQKLYQLEEFLHTAGFVRVRKNCIINQYKLTSIKIAQNSHIEATLNNGECVLVTRKYISEIKEAFSTKKST